MSAAKGKRRRRLRLDEVVVDAVFCEPASHSEAGALVADAIRDVSLGG